MNNHRSKLDNTVSIKVFEDTGKQYIEVELVTENAFNVLYKTTMEYPINDLDDDIDIDIKEDAINEINHLIFHNPYGFNHSYRRLLELTDIEYIEENECNGVSYFTLIFTVKRKMESNDFDLRSMFMDDIVNDDIWNDLLMHN